MDFCPIAFLGLKLNRGATLVDGYCQTIDLISIEKKRRIFLTYKSN